jgi:hypothetical protein
MSDRYAAALLLTGRFVYAPSTAELCVADPDQIRAAIGVEIETEAHKMLLGGSSDKVIELCCGAVALRSFAPKAHEWISSTALLRSPCCTRQYEQSSNFIGNLRNIIERTARTLRQEGKLSAAEMLWLIDLPPTALAY